MIHELSMSFQKMSDNVIQSDNGTQYYLNSLLKAVKHFNEKCPKAGGKLIRQHISHIKDVTHTTLSLRYENDKLIAQIDFLDKKDIDTKMKPIIATPLEFESGVAIKTILDIVNIYIADAADL